MEDNERFLSILVNTNGNYSACRAEDLHDGVEYDDVMIYAYDMSENGDESDLQAYFTINGAAYSIRAYRMSYNELGAVIDGILLDGIASDDFDLSKAKK